jgi:hypothetical protein
MNSSSARPGENRPEPGVQEKRVRQAPLAGYAELRSPIQEGAGAVGAAV